MYNGEKYKYFCHFNSWKFYETLSWLEHGATNTKIVGFIPVLAIHLTAGLDDPYESVPIQNILWIFCEVKSSIDCSRKKTKPRAKGTKRFAKCSGRCYVLLRDHNLIHMSHLKDGLSGCTVTITWLVYWLTGKYAASWITHTDEKVAGVEIIN